MSAMAVRAVAAVHEQVDDRAREQQQIRQRAHQVRLVLGPQVESCDRQEDAKACRRPS
jgi:hypothetical protein